MVGYNVPSAARVSASLFDNRMLPVPPSRSVGKTFAERKSISGAKTKHSSASENQASESLFETSRGRADRDFKRSRRDSKTSNWRRVSEKRESRRFSGWECQTSFLLLHPGVVDNETYGVRLPALRIVQLVLMEQVRHEVPFLL